MCEWKRDKWEALYKCQDVIFLKKSTFFFTHTQKVMNLPSLPLPGIQGQRKGDHQGSVAAQEVRRLGN